MNDLIHISESTELAVIEPTDADEKARDDNPYAGPNDNQRLREYVKRIMRLEDEKAETAACLSDVYKEAEAHGFDKEGLKLVIKHERKPTKETTRQIVNFYQSVLRKQPIYHEGVISDEPSSAH